jgi:hypothetical protein
LKKIAKIFFTALLLICFLDSFAQDKKGFDRNMDKANDLYDYGDYKNALSTYEEIYSQDSSNPRINYKIGSCLFFLKKNKKEALRYMQKGLSNDDPDSYYYVGQLYHLNTRFEEALKAFSDYKVLKGDKTFTDSEIDKMVANTKTAMEFSAHPVKVAITNMGKPINSKYPDYVPLISADESMLIFTSRRETSTGNLLDPNGDYFEDIFITNKEENGWSVPKSISANINTAGHDACVALSPDGEQLFLYRTDQTLTGGDLYLSKFDGKDWTPPVKLDPDINLERSVESSASLSADAETLYVASDREGGHGGRDIYRIVKLPNGKWSKAMNLGPMVNTAYDEDAPFIHPDGKTLYFSSKGHKNMGGYDIFKSVRNEEGAWSEPENMGCPVNSVEDDIYFVLSVSGRTGYYSSNKEDTYGSTDLYSLSMVSENFDLAVVGGFVYSSDASQKPLVAKITLMDENGADLSASYKSNALTGKYIMIVQPDKNYKVLIESEGYTPKTQEINSKESSVITKLDKAGSDSGSIK